MGMPWWKQESNFGVLELREAMSKDMAQGSLVRSRYDHNQGGSGVRSNKVITIFAARLLGRKPNNFDEAWETVCQVFFGVVPDRSEVAA